MEHSHAIRIVIADDHPIVREGLRTLLRSQPDFDVVGEAADGHEAVHLCARLGPDVLLLDLLMPGGGGLEALKPLAAEAPAVRPILLTGAIEKHEVVTALTGGARGVLLKESAIPILFKCIRSVAANHYWIGRDDVGGLVDALRNAMAPPAVEAPRTNPFGLTARELEIVAAIAAGETNKETAIHLSIRENTIKHHLRNIFDKVGVFSRLELAVFAMNHGLASGEHPRLKRLVTSQRDMTTQLRSSSRSESIQ